MTRNIIFGLALLAMVLALTYISAKVLRSRREADLISGLLVRLRPMDEGLMRSAVGSNAIGIDAVHRAIEQFGGWEMLCLNITTLVRIAEEIQVHHPEVLILAEELRRTATAISWHLDRLSTTVGGGSEEWLGCYGTAALRAYVVAVDSFIEICERVNESLCSSVRKKVWTVSASTI